eukprot:gene16114-7464_t
MVVHNTHGECVGEIGKERVGEAKQENGSQVLFFSDSQLRLLVEDTVSFPADWYINSTPGGCFLDVLTKMRSGSEQILHDPKFVVLMVETNNMSRHCMLDRARRDFSALVENAKKLFSGCQVVAIFIAPRLDDVDVRRHLFNQAMEEECQKFNVPFYYIENCIDFTNRQVWSSRASIHLSEDIALPSLVEGLKKYLCTASQHVVEPAVKMVQKCPEWLWRELKHHNVRGKLQEKKEQETRPPTFPRPKIVKKKHKDQLQSLKSPTAAMALQKINKSRGQVVGNVLIPWKCSTNPYKPIDEILAEFDASFTSLNAPSEGRQENIKRRKKIGSSIGLTKQVNLRKTFGGGGPAKRDGHICGVSTIICMCLAAYDFCSFISLKGTTEDENIGYRYLKNISHYSDFLRLTIAKWCMDGEIDVESLNTHRQTYPDTANVTSQQNRQNESPAVNVSEENENSIASPSIGSKQESWSFRLGKRSTSVCCDREKGLYMVKRSQHGESINSIDGVAVDCEVDSCRDEMSIAARSGMKGRECQHLLLVNNALFPESLQLDVEFLRNLGNQQGKNVLKANTIESCIDKQEEALANQAPESTVNHVAIGTICNILQGLWKIKIDFQKVFTAYAHFEALSERTYEFNCVKCGHFPTILIADLNRKVAFNCRVPDEALPDENDESSDFVNCDEFWSKIVTNSICTGFPNRSLPSVKVTPSLAFWAPYIGQKTRVGYYVVNSEHRKVHRKTGEPEIDCRELSQERLLEQMFEAKIPDVRRLARKVGVSAKGSKIDLINRMKEAIGRNDEKFNKIFKKMFGRSGGWLTLACTHGVIYAVKFLLRSESPRDYIDMIRSLKHKPNVFIVDMAHMVASHGNRYEEGFFSPYEGRVAEATPQNIENALEGNLQISFPWLLNNTSSKNDLYSHNGYCHPISGSIVRLALFDRFHEKNMSCETEALRRITCVAELAGQINSEVVE